MTHSLRIMIDQLTALAAGLCQDTSLELEVQPGPWKWDQIRHTIYVSEEDLVNKGPKYCAGFLVREIGRFYISRHHLFTLDYPESKAGRIFLDALDIPRAQKWMYERYSGCEKWCDELLKYLSPINPYLPTFIGFCLAIAHEERAYKYGVTQSIVDAFIDTHYTRQVYYEQYPESNLAQKNFTSLRSRYLMQVRPFLLKQGWLPSSKEQQVQLSAMEALRHAEEPSR